MIIKTPVPIVTKKLNVSFQAVYAWKKNLYLPSLENIKKLAKLEKVTVDKLLRSK